MSTPEIIAKIEELKSLEALIAEAEAEVESIKDSIKAEMLESGTEELIAGTHIVRWTTITSNRFDSGAFKKSHADLYKEFTKPSTSRRFTISD